MTVKNVSNSDKDWGRLSARGFAKKCALALLHGYRWAISPMLPASCRYVPTCSEYAVEAIELHGVLKGSVLAAWRLLRCHPFVSGGLDPVPFPRDLHGVVRSCHHTH